MPGLSKMGYRRLAREYALQALCYFDREKGDSDVMISLFLESFGQDLQEKAKIFFMELVTGVVSSAQEIDTLLNRYSTNWKLSRMPVVDRNIMRMAIFELTACPDIPASVSINEAVEIGKKYGTRESGAFINGVLDRIRIEEKIV